ncbi:MAG: Maf family protein [Phycisphaerales bacterium]
MESIPSPLPRVLLASRSPRRREFLSRAGVPHRAEHPGFDDAVLRPGRVTPREWVAALAYLKAWAGAALDCAGESEIVLGADTTCVKHGRMLGTPADEQEAAAMLEAFSESEHEVITGVAMIERSTGRRHIFTDSASVRVGKLTDSMISDYLATGGWKGKAGGYNLSERVEAGWPIVFEGDETTIMGLPMRALLPMLARPRGERAKP